MRIRTDHTPKKKKKKKKKEEEEVCGTVGYFPKYDR